MNASDHLVPRHVDSRGRRAFTITELLVVIGIIVLLVGLLLPALAKVRTTARKTTTASTMDEFSKACEAFFQDHGRYPGLIPDVLLAGNPVISGTENALFELMGGAVRGDLPEYDETTYSGWTEVIVDNSAGPIGRFRYDLESLGQGPIINGKKYAPYFTPSPRELRPVEGQYSAFAGGDDAGIPDLVDAWGQPIIYLRRQRSIGPLCAPHTNVPAPQFVREPAVPYLQSPALGDLGQNQTTRSLLSIGDPERQTRTLAQVIRIPSIGKPEEPLSGESRGAFVLISAGPDGIYLSSDDGPGDPGAIVEDITDGTYPATIVAEYDDVIAFGGG